MPETFRALRRLFALLGALLLLGLLLAVQLVAERLAGASGWAFDRVEKWSRAWM